MMKSKSKQVEEMLIEDVCKALKIQPIPILTNPPRAIDIVAKINEIVEVLNIVLDPELFKDGKNDFGS